MRAVLLLFAVFAAIPIPDGLGQEAEISFPPANRQASIQISARQGSRWQRGAYEVWHLRGEIHIGQSSHKVQSNEAILWIHRSPDQSPEPDKVICYLEGDVLIELPGSATADKGNRGQAANRIVDERWFGRLFTNSEIDVRVEQEVTAAENLPIYLRADQAFSSGTQSTVRPVQFVQEGGLNQIPAQNSAVLISPQTGAIQQQPSPQPSLNAPANITRTYQNPVPNQVVPPATRVEINPQQSGLGATIKTVVSEVPGEMIIVGTGKIRITIDSQELAIRPEFRNQSTRVTILADNIIAWSNALNPTQPVEGEQRWELYLEGNVKFQMGERVVFAEQMYYDANFQRGTILRAEMLTPIRRYKGLVRLKADVIQQLDQNNFSAYGTALTSSRIGVPRYWLQNRTLNVTREQEVDADPFTGVVNIDPQTGMARTKSTYFAEGQGNAVYAGNIPVLYWPRFRTNLDNPSYFVETIRIGNDRIFGSQIGASFDMYQVLGIRRPPKDSSWTSTLDYLSDRGFAYGSENDYQHASFLGFGPAQGTYRSWFIRDKGLDNLGRDRRTVPLEEDKRGQIFLQHRQQLRSDLKLQVELGWLSDRNFLEQYFERRWDQYKDYTTGFLLERKRGNRSLALSTEFHLNDFFTQTQWLPRLDRFVLGQAGFAGRVVRHGHSHVGYADFEPGVPPTNAVDLAKFDPLAHEVAAANGVRVGTRQELDFPIQAGHVKFVPYVLGDLTYWQEDLLGNDMLRAMGQVGVRSSVPFTRIDPTITSTLFNVNGLAHKVTFDTDIGFADASQDMDRLPLYDPLDDDAQEHFRRRFAFDTFNIMAGDDVPLRFDERFYALRSGLQSNVTSPSAEVVDDLAFVKFGMRNRLQTKRGLPGRESIIDWVTLDVEAIFYPDADRDNFGSDFGMLDYDFRWHVGDRFAILSDGYFDFFSDGLRTASIGVDIQRPEVGDLYIGMRTIQGVVTSNVLTARLNYRMSDKWAVQATSSYDFSSTGNIGQRIAALYIGESFIYRAGFNVDVSRGNVGVLFGMEPRFLLNPRIFRAGGRPISPAGSRWLE